MLVNHVLLKTPVKLHCGTLWLGCMDPLAESPCPSRSGYVGIDDDCRIYYELWGVEGAPLVVLVMGAFATSRYFHDTAFFLAQEGFQVLTYHHRNVGKTSSPRSKYRVQTPASLADDALMLVNELCGPVPLHLMGASMGGLVAQEAAKQLLSQGRLLSLLLAVSWDGTGKLLGQGLLGHVLRPLLTLTVVRMLVPYIFPDAQEPWKQAHKTVCRVFTQEDRAMAYHGVGSPTPSAPPGTPWGTVGDAWTHAWASNLDAWFTYRDSAATACQVHLLLHLNTIDTASVRDSDVPKAVVVATEDTLVTPEDQLALASGIRAQAVLELHSGHMMASSQAKRQYERFFLDHLRRAEAVRRSRATSAGGATTHSGTPAKKTTRTGRPKL